VGDGVGLGVGATTAVDGSGLVDGKSEPEQAVSATTERASSLNAATRP
jgi:hypothetical protein